MALVDGSAKFMSSVAIDRSDIIAQLSEIYSEGASIEIFLLKEVG